jgi:hypothetical protein
MPTIAESLSSPSWWFTAVFVAIIASVIAAFTRDWMQQAASHLSKRTRARIARKNELDARTINALARDDTKLILYSQSVTRTMILFAMASIFYLLVPTTFAALLHPGLQTGNALIDASPSPRLVILTTAIFGAVAIFFAVNGIQRLRLLQKARSARELRRRTGGIEA